MTKPNRQIPIILLPGLDGTGMLFQPFIDTCPTSFAPKVISYPDNKPLSYPALEKHVFSQLPDNKPFLLLGESFSGPIALNIAAQQPKNLMGVILSATFILSPVANWLKLFPIYLMARILPHNVAIQYMLLNGKQHPSMMRLVKKAAAKVHPDVISYRIYSVFHVDASDVLRQIQAPILYLSGLKDRLVNGKSGRLIKQIKPEVNIAKINSPHLLLQLQPEAAWQAIENFTDRALGHN